LIRLSENSLVLDNTGQLLEDANRLVSDLDPNEQARFRAEYQESLSCNQNTEGLMGISPADTALIVVASNDERG
jgi:hypothetical protein